MRYFHDKKITAYYCFSATLLFSTNNSILNSCVKWSLFSDPVTYYVIVTCNFYCVANSVVSVKIIQVNPELESDGFMESI